MSQLSAAAAQPPAALEASPVATETTSGLPGSPTTAGRTQQQQQNRSSSHQRYPIGTKVVEISNGRQFVSRPLDHRLLANNLQYHQPTAGQQAYQSAFTTPLFPSQPARFPQSRPPGQRQVNRQIGPQLFNIFTDVKPADLYEVPNSSPAYPTMRNPVLSPSSLRNDRLPPVLPTFSHSSLPSLFQKSSSISRSPPSRTRVPTEINSSSRSLLTELFEGTKDLAARMTQPKGAPINPFSQPFGTPGSSEVLAFGGSQPGLAQQHDYRRYGPAPASRQSSPQLSRTRGGINWLFEAAASAGGKPESPLSKAAAHFCQQSLLSARGAQPSPRQTFPPAAAAVVQSFSRDPWQFSCTEDLVDDELLFRHEELQRRRNPRYLSKAKRLHDLHIVMPICVPYGRIVVEDPLGANFYSFSNKPKNAGAEILFGKGITDQPEAEDGSESSKTCGQNKENEKQRSRRKSDAENFTRIKPVCDVWASFLHVRLGTIYNLSPRQTPVVADLFRKSFDPDLCKFYVPIAMDCRGVHPSSDDLISHRASRPAQLMRETREGRSTAAAAAAATHSERYETHAVPTSENDIKRLRMLRRHLRQFAMRLSRELDADAETSWKGFGDEESQMSRGLGNDQQPRACVELHDNCRTDTILNGTLKIVVREWSPLSDPEAFKRVWGGHLASPESHRAQSPHHSSVAVDVRTKLLEHKTIPSARVLAGELRLEHNHLRMVDPRWPEELVAGRRVADSCIEEPPGSEESRARFVFCSSVPKPEVIYAYAEADGSDPRDAALNSRLSFMVKAHLARHPSAGVKTFQTLTTAATATTTTQALRLSSGTADPQDNNNQTHLSTATVGTLTPSNGQLTPGAATSSNSAEAKGPSAEQREDRCVDGEINGVSVQHKEEDVGVQPGEPIKPITSLAELKTIPEPFVPARHSFQYDRTEGPELLHSMLKQTREAERISGDKSALKSGDINAFQMPITTVTCKYFLNDGCARGSFCHFLHPADPKLESKVDVRHVVPKHPKFF